MQRHFGMIEALEDIGEVLLYSRTVCREQGAVRQSYHLTPQFESPTSMHTTVFADGFSEDWLRRYDEEDFRKSDPIPERTMEHAAMLTWEDARTIAPNTPENEAYFKAMDEEGLIHGFGLPLFGPNGRDAFASFDFGVPVSQISNAALGVVRAVPQAAHQRVSVLLASRREIPELSSREAEVLQWVARGKSLSSIAGILDLSYETVKTYCSRIYTKLEVSDRVGATVAALKLGLVRI